MPGANDAPPPPSISALGQRALNVAHGGARGVEGRTYLYIGPAVSSRRALTRLMLKQRIASVVVTPVIQAFAGFHMKDKEKRYSVSLFGSRDTPLQTSAPAALLATLQPLVGR